MTEIKEFARLESRRDDSESGRYVYGKRRKSLFGHLINIMRPEPQRFDESIVPRFILLKSWLGLIRKFNFPATSYLCSEGRGARHLTYLLFFFFPDAEAGLCSVRPRSSSPTTSPIYAPHSVLIGNSYP